MAIISLKRVEAREIAESLYFKHKSFDDDILRVMAKSIYSEIIQKLIDAFPEITDDLTELMEGLD